MGGISTFATSILLLVCTSGVKGLLAVASLLLICIFVLCGAWLGLGLLLLVFTMWQLSMLVSHQVNLSSLHFTYNLLDMSHCGPLSSHISLDTGAPCLLETCPGLHCLHLWSGTQILLHPERTKICPYGRSLQFSGGYFARLIWACTQLYHSSTLFYPWWKLVNKSNLACTSLDWGLQNSSNWDQIVSKSNSSFVKPHDTYWSIPKCPLQAMTFLHCWGSGRAASSHSSIFSHFNLYKLSLTVQSILGPSIYGMNICCLTGLGACGLLGWNEISLSESWSEVALSSWELGISTSWPGIAEVSALAELFTLCIFTVR